MTRMLRLKSLSQLGAKVGKPVVPLPTESQEQQKLIAWFDFQCPQWGLRPEMLLSIPNGSVLAGDAKHRAIQMSRLKREGLRKGAPDLFLAVAKDTAGWGAACGGLFVEMKRVGEIGRPEQIAFADMLRRSGYHVVIAQGFEEAKRAICGYLES